MTAAKRRLLLLSVSAGAGHVRAAEALRVAAETQFDAQAVHLDVMDDVPADSTRSPNACSRSTRTSSWSPWPGATRRCSSACARWPPRIRADDDAGPQA